MTLLQIYFDTFGINYPTVLILKTHGENEVKPNKVCPRKLGQLHTEDRKIFGEKRLEWM